MFVHDNYPEALRILMATIQEKGGKAADATGLAGIAALLSGDDVTATAQFRRLALEAGEMAQRSRGAFWYHRLTGGANQEPAIQKVLAQATTHPETFYGMLVLEQNRDADQIKRQFAKAGAMELSCPDRTGTAPETLDTYRRMRLLHAMELGNLYNGAEIEQLGRRERLGRRDLICLALRLDVPQQATRYAESLMTEKGGDVVWSGLYPRPAWQPGQGWQLDPSLIWAVVRQESRFSRHVVSSAGAMGLLQLMPLTAQEEARKLGLPASSPLQLKQTSYNLSLGQSYLFRMLQRFSGDLVLAVAAYNAGPKRSLQWQELRCQRDPLLFVESIPISETRGYVQKVLHNFAVYRMLAQQDGSLTTMLSQDGASERLSSLLATPRP
jgi:soluble lytic murein transglycosylase